MTEDKQVIEVAGQVVETIESVDITNLIVVKQIPIIEEHLLAIKAQIQADVNDALALDCTEDTKNQVKKIRAELNKQFKELEEKRKGVKGKVLEPYNQFEAIYKSCVTEVFKPADNALREKIAAVELVQKQEKEKKAREYFAEYSESLNIDFVKFEDVGLNITLNISDKKCKETCKAFLDKVAEDIALIDTQEHKDEILVEYKASLNVSTAITTVCNRHKAIEEENRRRVEAEAKAKAEAEHQAVVENVIAEEQAENEPELNGFAANGPIAAAIPQSEHINTNNVVKKYKIAFEYETENLDSIKEIKAIMERNGTYEQL